MGGDGDVGELVVVGAVQLAQDGQAQVRLERLPGGIQHRHAVQARHLRRRVHDRGARGVLHRLAREDRTDLLPQGRDLLAVGRRRGDDRQVELARQVEALAVAEPGLQREVAAGREVGLAAVQRHDPGQGHGDVRDVADDGTLGRADRVLGREDVVDPEHLHEPAFLGRRIVAGAGDGAGMAHGPGQLRLPAADDAGDHGLGRLQFLLVVAARLDIEDGGLAAVVVAQRPDELGCREVDVDVLAAGDQRGGAPAGGGEVAGDRGGEVAGVGEDRDRALEQGLARIVAAQRPADPHPVPGVGDAEAVGAQDVDAPRLAKRPDLAAVVHRDLLGDDDDLLEIRVDPDELRHAVAHGRGRQVDHAGVEAVAGVQAVADIVEDRDLAHRRLQLLPPAAGRGAEDDVPAREGVAHRRDLARTRRP